MYGAWFKETRGTVLAMTQHREENGNEVFFFFLTLKDPWRLAQRACSFSVTPS